MATDAEIRVVAATIDHWSLLRELFATSRGVDACWCAWPLRPPGKHRPDRARNRSSMQARLRAGESPGLLAIRGGRAVGWCAFGRRDRFRQYDDLEDDGGAWAIPCLYIEPRADRRSVARALIAAATDRAARAAATAIDGPPPRWLPGDEAAIALATDTFLENGFVLTARGARMPRLRRPLPASEESNER